MGEAVQERCGEPGVTADFRLAGEVQVGGYQYRATLVAVGQETNSSAPASEKGTNPTSSRMSKSSLRRVEEGNALEGVKLGWGNPQGLGDSEAGEEEETESTTLAPTVLPSGFLNA